MNILVENGKCVDTGSLFPKGKGLLKEAMHAPVFRFLADSMQKKYITSLTPGGIWGGSSYTSLHLLFSPHWEF